MSGIQLGVVLVGDHADGIQHAVELLKDGGPLHITLNGFQRQRRLLSLFEQLDHLVDAVADLVRCLQQDVKIAKPFKVGSNVEGLWPVNGRKQRFKDQQQSV